MSLPTLRNDLAKIYEPHTPAPSQRPKTLPYPECDDNNLAATLSAVRDLDPVTVFHEPINIRAENVRRIEEHALSLGVSLETDTFESRESWADYPLKSLRSVECIAGDLGMSENLHLWPDKSLATKWMLKRMKHPEEHLSWLNKLWSRISEWPMDHP